MKMCLDSDEYYPFYSLEEFRTDGAYQPGKTVEVSEELAQRYTRIMSEFEELQGELSKLRKAA